MIPPTGSASIAVLLTLSGVLFLTESTSVFSAQERTEGWVYTFHLSDRLPWTNGRIKSCRPCSWGAMRDVKSFLKKRELPLWRCAPSTTPRLLHSTEICSNQESTGPRHPPLCRLGRGPSLPSGLPPPCARPPSAAIRGPPLRDSGPATSREASETPTLPLRSRQVEGTMRCRDWVQGCGGQWVQLRRLLLVLQLRPLRKQVRSLQMCRKEAFLSMWGTLRRRGQIG
mmetsp:Transcript_15889/g.32232  ORF Transcript_15889/g.32232 Transcript_15889/m.32232 type:complete len:227 (+) Transcript_15889:253-933(+)